MLIYGAYLCFSVLTQVCFTEQVGSVDSLCKMAPSYYIGSQILNSCSQAYPQASFHSLSRLAGLSPLFFFNWIYWAVHFQMSGVFLSFCLAWFGFFVVLCFFSSPCPFWLVYCTSCWISFTSLKLPYSILYLSHLWGLFQIKARI